jgi:Paf1.
MDKVEAKVGFSIKKNFKEDNLYMDRDSQVKAIEKTFADSKLPIEKHYSKPNVTPVEIMPVYPDFKVSELFKIERIFYFFFCLFSFQRGRCLFICLFVCFADIGF